MGTNKGNGLTAIIVSAASMLFVACGGVSVPSDAEGFILDGASNVVIQNYELMLGEADIPFLFLNDDEDQDDFKDDLAYDWEDNSYSFGNSAHSVSRIIYVFGEADFEGHQIIKGEFDFIEIRNKLDDEDFEEDTYRDFELWEHENGDAVVLFEAAGTYIHGNSDVVKEIIKAIDRGEGLIDSTATLRRALG